MCGGVYIISAGLWRCGGSKRHVKSNLHVILFSPSAAVTCLTSENSSFPRLEFAILSSFPVLIQISNHGKMKQSSFCHFGSFMSFSSP